MKSHRFACGEDVILTTKSGPIFTVTRLLPFEAMAAPRYWVKTAHESFNRVVQEGDIRVPPMTEPGSGALEDRTRRADRTAAEALFIRRRVSR